MPKKIIIIKFCGVGDLILLLPMLYSIRSTYPSAKITLVTSEWVKELIPCISSIDSCILSNAPYEKSIWKKLFATFKLMQRIRNIQADMAVVGHRNTFFGFLSLISGAQIRLGFVGTKYLTHACKFDSSLHEVDRYMAIPALLEMKPIEKKTELRSSPSERNNVQAKLSLLNINQDERVIIVYPGGGENPGTSMTIKRWSPDYYISLLRRIRAKYPYPIILIGSNDESQLGKCITDEVDGVHNLVGIFSLNEMVALGSRCRLFIGGDSGPTHLIAATGAPTLSLFGPSDPRLVAPRGEKQVYLWKQPLCAPCYTPKTVLMRQYFQGKTFICHTGTLECMKSLTVDEVWNAAQQLLDQREAN